MIDNSKPRPPSFDFEVPKGYSWLIDKGLVGFDTSPLEPWQYLPEKYAFWVNEVWPSGPYEGRLKAFARRGDNDDIACFQVSEGRVTGIVLIHGWTTPNGYALLGTYDSFWNWLKFVVIDDVMRWVEHLPPR